MKLYLTKKDVQILKSLYATTEPIGSYRQFLQGITFLAREDGVHAVASDGKRLSAYVFTEYKAKKSEVAFLKSEDLIPLLKKKGDFVIDVEENDIDVNYSISIYDEQLIPPKTKQIEVDVKQFKSAITAIQKVKTKYANPVSITAKEGVLDVRFATDEKEGNEEEITKAVKELDDGVEKIEVMPKASRSIWPDTYKHEKEHAELRKMLERFKAYEIPFKDGNGLENLDVHLPLDNLRKLLMNIGSAKKMVIFWDDQQSVGFEVNGMTTVIMVMKK